MRLPMDPKRSATAGSGRYVHWLAVPLDAEIAETAARLAAETPCDWIVVDHYALDRTWEKAIRPYGKRILAIDDLADRPHDCDLLLDQNLQSPGRYDLLVSTACVKMIGPRYALLRPEFREARSRLRDRDGTVSRIMLFFGGSDADDQTGKALAALTRIDDPDLNVTVVIGASNPRSEELRARCAAMPRVCFRDRVEDMAALMAGADLALCATGTTTWERAALGLPTLAVSIADNQTPIAQAASRAGLLTWLGDGADIGAAEWEQALRHALAAPALLRQQAAAGLELVDGNGAERVAAAMLQ